MLELKHVDYITEDGVKILKDINLTLDKHFVAITGPNGGGKSTLAKVIAGIYQPSSGEIIFDGQDITRASITERARMGVSFAFQQPVRFKGLRVIDLMKLAIGDKGGVKEIDAYLEAVGLPPLAYRNRDLNESLSGGELKRIEIAMLLARQTKLSIFDEPEAGIDLWSFKNLIHVFQNMRDMTQGSIVIISHQERILNIADKIVVMKDGMVAGYGDREEILPKLLAGTNSVVDLQAASIAEGRA